MKREAKRVPFLPKSRVQWEILAVVILLVFGLSVFLVGLHSKGALTYDKGKITYSGQIVNHRMNGYGKLTYPNGDIYEGNFVNGVFQGYGTFTAKSGWYYKGEFKKGKPDGKVTLKAKNNKVYKGTFKQGIYQK